MSETMTIDGVRYRVESERVVTTQGVRVVDGEERPFEFRYTAVRATPVGKEIPEREGHGSAPLSVSHNGAGVAVSPGAGPAYSGVRETSRDAYAKHRASGKLGRQHEVVLAALRGRARDMTRQELARETGLGINAVCGRVNELMDEPFCLVEVHRRRACDVTGESVEALRAVETA